MCSGAGISSRSSIVGKRIVALDERSNLVPGADTARMAYQPVELRVVGVECRCILAKSSVVQEFGPVVRGEQNHRVLETAKVGDSIEQPSDPFVHVGNLAVVECFDPLLLVIGSYLGRRVRHDELRTREVRTVAVGVGAGWVPTARADQRPPATAGTAHRRDWPAATRSPGERRFRKSAGSTWANARLFNRY